MRQDSRRLLEQLQEVTEKWLIDFDFAVSNSPEVGRELRDFELRLARLDEVLRHRINS